MIDVDLVWRSLPDAFRKLDPRVDVEEPGDVRGGDRLGR